MTKSSLNPAERQTVGIIESLGYGSIVRLYIRGGSPCYEPERRIVQSIKLDAEAERKHEDGDPDLTLKKEFESLFDQMRLLRDGVVDIEVRHSLPFRLVLERRLESLL